MTAAALATGAALVSWPFLIAPQRFLYIRYFDADTIFGGWWKLSDLVSVWDAHLHLGYAHARDLSYLSVQEILSVLATPLGDNFRNRSSLICVALAIFFAFWWFARMRFPKTPGLMSAIAAFLYASNPFVMAFVHDGYSGLLVDYALLPASVLIVECARRRNAPVLLSLIPVVFVITGMYNLTSVLVALIGVLVLEFRYLYSALRESRPASAAVALGFSLNAYWLLPLLYDLALHPKQPILAETANDVSALTGAGTLTNTLLLRSYPEIWTKAYGVRECTGCTFYESPWFMSAMLFVAVAAMVGLIRARKYGLLAALVLSVLIATGYHYQNEIIGIPYLILMGLPTFDMFRSSVKFSALTAMFYSIGLLYCYGTLKAGQKLFATICAIAVLVVGMPYISSSMMERSSHVAAPRFPNFVVSIPAYYGQLRQHAELLPDDRPTLLLPNMPLTSYSWGAYGNDFLTPYLSKPTLAMSYLPQPSLQLELILKQLTGQRTPAVTRKALLAALGISRVLYRDDVSETQPLPKSEFGNEVARFGALHVLANYRAFPLFGVTRSLDPVVGATGIATYAGLWKRPSRGFDAGDSTAVCNGQRQIGIEPLSSRRGRQTIEIPVTCRTNLTGLLAVARAQGAGIPSLVHLPVPAGSHSLEIPNALRGRVVMAAVGRAPSIQPEDITSIFPDPIGRAAFRFDPLPFAHYMIFSENFDPSWAGYIKADGGWRAVSDIPADGFANAWYVPAHVPFLIVNTLILVTWGAAAFTLLLLAAFVYVFRRALHKAE